MQRVGPKEGINDEDLNEHSVRARALNHIGCFCNFSHCTEMLTDKQRNKLKTETKPISSSSSSSSLVLI